jgi:NADPH:quinone reductase-like Zn-dependent oxidoreductase
MLMSPINPSDLMTVRGVYGKQPRLPAVPGYEGVGIVSSADAGLYGRFLVGRRVAVLNSRTGNWQDHAVANVASIIPIPAAVPLEQAAMFFVNPATAWLLTRHVLAVPRSEWLLQSAAHSAVGKMVIRLGRRFGFKTCNIVRRDDQVAELKSLGADAVLVHDSAKQQPNELVGQVRDAVGAAGVRFAIDPVGGAVASAVVNCLGIDGRLVLYGTLSDEPMQFSPRTLMTVGSTVEGFWLSRFMPRQSVLSKLRLIRTLGRLILEDVLSSDVAQTFPLAEIRAAVHAAETPARPGKILLTINDK